MSKGTASRRRLTYMQDAKSLLAGVYAEARHESDETMSQCRLLHTVRRRVGSPL